MSPDTDSTVGKLLAERDDLKLRLAFFQGLVDEYLEFCTECGKYLPNHKFSAIDNLCVSCWERESERVDPRYEEPQNFNERREDGVRGGTP